jgi:hypothetical protein
MRQGFEPLADYRVNEKTGRLKAEADTYFQSSSRGLSL